MSALQKIPSDLLSLPIYGTAIDSADDVRDLGVWLDSELTMKHHISKIISVCFYHIGRLRQLRDKVSQDTMRQLVTSLVLSRIDYCNIVLAGLYLRRPLLHSSVCRTLLHVLSCDWTVGHTLLQLFVSSTGYR